MPLSRFGLTARIFIATASTLILFGMVTFAVGIRHVDQQLMDEAKRRIASYLKAAWSVYDTNLEGITRTLALLARNPVVREIPDSLRAGGAQADAGGNAAWLRESGSALENIRREWGLDYLGLTDPSGRVIARGRFPFLADDYVWSCCLSDIGLARGSCGGTVIIPKERLEREGQGLTEKAYVEFRETPKALPRAGTAETAGMALHSCAVLRNPDGTPLAIVYGGTLLNRNFDMVDKVRQIVFGDEKFEGRDVGTVTIFQWDLRVATNVRDADGNRAVGTRVSEGVHETVLEKGQPWLDSAFVVNDWYVSAYDPIRSLTGEIIGMLYVGELRARYGRIKQDMVAGFFVLATIGLAVVLVLAFFFSRHLTRPLSRLTLATREIGAGFFDIEVPLVRTSDEIGELTRAFRGMAQELEERGSKLHEAHTELVSANRELQRTIRNYLDLLGFVSHEMRSPLAAALMALQMMEDGLKGRISDSEAIILSKIKKKVQVAVDMSNNYLNLSRIERKELPFQPRSVTLLTEVVGPLVNNMSEEIRERDMQVTVEVPADCIVYGDPNLLSVVYGNLLSNALKYGRRQGKIVLGCTRREDHYRLTVFNEGTGIDEEDRGRLFKRFSRLEGTMFTREKGTGLGLFITKAAVELHGGTIWVEGKKDLWACFTFTLPPARE